MGRDPTFVDALDHDLLPWLTQRSQRTFAASATMIGGASLAGLAVLYTAMRQP
jgi:enterochelin esterase-like enzyme